MHESNYQTAIRNVIDQMIKSKGFDKQGFYTIQEEGRSDIRIQKYAKTCLVLEVKKTRNDVSKPKWWERARSQATNSGAEYFGITNGERLILFRHKAGARVADCMLEPGAISIGDYGPNGEADDVLQRFEEKFQEIFIHLFIEQKEYKYEKSLNTLLERYKDTHKLLVLELIKGLKTKLRDSSFKKEFLSWARSFSNTPESPSNIIIAAEECGYVILNRILFYEILRNELNGIDDRIKKKRGIPRISLSSILLLASIPLKDFLSELGRLYKKILRIDYDQVFSTTGNVLDKIPLNNAALTILQGFVEDLRSFSLTRGQIGEPANLFSMMFEKLIPIEKRHDYGQVFTEKILVDVLCRLCIREKDVNILDPACGTGSFLDAAYERIRLLYQRDGKTLTHPQILKFLHGVEISKFPMHLCAMRLALKDTTYATNADLREKDFFKINPSDVCKDNGVDVILCNPPYLRHEVIPRSEKRYIRSRIRKTLVPIYNRNYPYSPGRADKYFYFVEYSTAFLKPGGFAGWVLSDKFLVNTSGRDLKRFLLDHYLIKAVIKFGRRSFPDFMVDNCLLFLQKPRKTKEIYENKTKFLKIKQEMTVDEIENQILNGRESSNAIRRLVVKNQKDLDPNQRWTDFFLDLSILDKIKNTEGIVPLVKICSLIRRGRDDGCSEFFYPKKYIKDFDLDRFLVEGLKSSRDISSLILKSEDCEDLLLIPPDTDLDAPQNRGLRRFIDFASSDTFDPDYRDRTTKKYVRVPNRTTVLSNSKRSGRPWYSFDPGRNDFDIIIPRMVRTFYKILYAEAKPYLSTNFWGIKLKDELNDYRKTDLDVFLVCAFLNSSLGELQFENKGRNYVGLIKMERPDIKELVVIDPKFVGDQDKREIKEIFIKLSGNFKTEKYKLFREQLDKKLLSILGLYNLYDDLVDTLEELKSARKKSGMT